MKSPSALDTPDDSIARPIPIDEAIMINKLKSMTSRACEGVIQPQMKQMLENSIADCSMGMTSKAGRVIIKRKLTMGT